MRQFEAIESLNVAQELIHLQQVVHELSRIRGHALGALV